MVSCPHDYPFSQKVLLMTNYPPSYRKSNNLLLFNMNRLKLLTNQSEQIKIWNEFYLQGHAALEGGKV